MKFIIEHLEPELYDWCLIEYEHISKIVGKENLIFTNINKKYKNTGLLMKRVFVNYPRVSLCAQLGASSAS